MLALAPSPKFHDQNVGDPVDESVNWTDWFGAGDAGAQLKLATGLAIGDALTLPAVISRGVSAAALQAAFPQIDKPDNTETPGVPRSIATVPPELVSALAKVISSKGLPATALSEAFGTASTVVAEEG
jgi:hypothetical protein